MRTKRIYLYRECDQPENGWFKACFVCRATTAQTLLFEEKTQGGMCIQHMVYVCPECKRALRKDDELRTAYEREVLRHLRRY